MFISKRLILGLACTALCAAFAGCGGGGSSSGGSYNPVNPTVSGNYLFQVGSLSSDYTATMLVSSTSTASENIELSVNTPTVAKASEAAEAKTDEAEGIGPHDFTNILAEKFRPEADRVALNAKINGKPDFKTNTKYTDCAKDDTVEIYVYKNLRNLTKIDVKKVVDNSETSSVLVFSEILNDGSTIISHDKALEIDEVFGTNNIYHKNGAPIAKTVRSTFGKEFSPGIDGTDKIIIFVLQSSTIGNGVYGYFNGADEYPTNESSSSNEGEILYVNGDIDDYDLYSTIGHEFQHMCSYNQKVILDGAYSGEMEKSSVNEGRSVLAEDLCGFSLKGSDGEGETCNTYILQCASSYLNTPEDVSFSEFNNTNGEYGGNYLLQRYVADRFGISVITDAATNTDTGLDNVANAAGIPFRQLFADFGVANLVSNLNGADKIYNYKAISLTEAYGDNSKKLGHAEPASVVINNASNIARATVQPYSNSYYSFRCSSAASNLQVGLTAPSSTSVSKMALLGPNGLNKLLDAIKQ
ncbi:hypothetical protein IJT93_09665 [bacterium]|nr:hypothetical protein [bacterium]